MDMDAVTVGSNGVAPLLLIYHSYVHTMFIPFETIGLFQ